MKHKAPRKSSFGGTRWMIVSPYQEFECTLSAQRKGAWKRFEYNVFEDVEKWKKKGFRAVKVDLKIKVLA